MRELDLILYGATGFVGRLVAEHLAAVAPPDLRVGLAGRSVERLERVRADLGPAADGWLLALADSGDAASLRSLAERSRVVVSTVGPYLRHGLPLAEACADAGTDYLDLTGEVLFVRELVERCHERAERSGARLVVSSGFDSVPSDLSVHVLAALAAERGAGGLTDTTLRVRELSGGISGGTIDSLRAQLERAQGDPSLRRILADPAALTGGVPVREAPDASRHFRDAETGEWAAPFVMASYNTRLVLRSHALRGRGYGDGFRYREIVPTGRGTAGRVRAAGLAAGVKALGAAMATPGLRRVVDAALPAPGEGPSEEVRERGHFRLVTSTRTERGDRLEAVFAAQGDPGYAATSVMLGEAALALALDGERCSPRGGVLTPATAMGDVLVERLRAQGFTIDAAPAREPSGAA